MYVFSTYFSKEKEKERKVWGENVSFCIFKPFKSFFLLLGIHFNILTMFILILYSSFGDIISKGNIEYYSGQKNNVFFYFYFNDC